MNKSQLIDKLSARFEGNKKQAAHALDSVLDTITREVARGEKVAITGFGSFERKIRQAGKARNPQTGATIRTKKKNVPKFTPGQDLKNVVSGAKKLPKLVAGATSSGGAAKKSSAAKKSTAAKSTAAKKSTAKKGTATKSTAAKKSSPAKKTAAQKSTAAKSTTAKKSSPAKKSGSAAKKTATKSAAKKSPAKSPAKKSPAKKSPAKKTAKKS